ncbi:hypothetical protein SAMN03159424_05414 [Pseudomonas sp. NFACC05-1]|nr:hypothetical protein SAMN03159424_05414 [Pseudomonas sp. NFACC05-1]
MNLTRVKKLCYELGWRGQREVHLIDSLYSLQKSRKRFSLIVTVSPSK